ncbi:cyclin-C-like isoform X2 [Stegodyphus dumicola]|nr:cyclin-C-like isoform X2 [Stegodyphus dumicola]
MYPLLSNEYMRFAPSLVIMLQWKCEHISNFFFYYSWTVWGDISVINMAGNFWQSSHFQQWLLDRQDLLRERHHDLQIFSEEEYQKVMIFFANFIQALGEQLKVKQQVIATATVYFKRFFVR